MAPSILCNNLIAVFNLRLMAAATVHDLLATLQKGNIPPVMIIFGEEGYFLDQITHWVEQNAISEADRGFNQQVFFGKEAKVMDILDAAQSFPMMAEKKVIIVKEAQEVSDADREEGNKKLLRYFEKPNPTTILLWVVRNEKPDGRKAAWKFATSKGFLFEAPKMKEYQIPEFIHKYLALKQIKANPDAVQQLLDLVGADLVKVVNELDKLLLNLKPQQVLNSDMVLANVGLSREFNIFELQKALVMRDTPKALKIVRYFAANPKASPLIPNVAMLFTFFSKVLLAHGVAGQPEAVVAKTIGVPPFAVKDYLAAVRVFPRRKLAHILHLLHLADLRSKGMGGTEAMGEEAIYTELVMGVVLG